MKKLTTIQFDTLRIPLAAVILSFILVFAFLPLPDNVFPMILSLLFLIWSFTFFLQRKYDFADLPLMLLLLGTFCGGRAFSLLGVNIGPIPLYVTEAALGASLVLLAFRFLRDRSVLKEWTEPLPKGLMVGILSFMGIGAVYMVVGVLGNGTVAFRDIVFSFYGLFFFVALSFFSRFDKIDTLTRFGFPAIVPALMVGVANMFWYVHPDTAFSTFFTNIKMFNVCFYLGLILIGALAFWGRARGMARKGLLTFLIYFPFLLIVLLEVRSSWFGLLLVLFLLAVLLKKEFKIMALVVVLMVLSLCLVDVFDLGIRKNRIASLAEQVKSVSHRKQHTMPGANIKWRLGLWAEAGEVIKEHPVFGWGYGIQIDHLQWGKSLSYLKAMGQSNGILPVHNHLIAVTYKMGIVGLLLFVFINARIFFYGFFYVKKCKCDLKRRILIAALAAQIYWHGMALFFDVMESPPTSFFLWVIPALILAVIHFDRKESPEASPVLPQ